jgi:hypothetical protein
MIAQVSNDACRGWVGRGWSCNAKANVSPLNYAYLSQKEIFHSIEDCYKQFYFLSPKIAFDSRLVRRSGYSDVLRQVGCSLA